MVTTPHGVESFSDRAPCSGERRWAMEDIVYMGSTTQQHSSKTSALSPNKFLHSTPNGSPLYSGNALEYSVGGL